MDREHKGKSAFAALVARMRDDKRLEISVYCVIAAAALLIFAATGGFSKARRTAPEDTSELPSAAFRSESELEERLKEVLSGIRGAGRVEVMAVCTQAEGSSSEPTVGGVIVLAEGADDIRVRTDIQNAVRTLLGIETGRIGVYVLQPQG